jgi:GH15 family glucan-1,4-alpha-glucosidase
VAVDRGVKTIECYGVDGPLESWRNLRAEIAADIWAHGFDADRNHFKRSFEDGRLDASLLLLAEVGFVAPDHPAFRGTVAAIERELMCDGFVLRYDTHKSDDGLPPGEGAFLACSFWLADAYHLLGRADDATALFERLLTLTNDLGLLSEEFDPRLGRMTGNFPQAFSHIGLINTAFNLTRARKPNEQRAQAAGARQPAP